jgi:tetratricopeptide (TPR) repeat protein
MGRVDLAERTYAQALVLEPESPQTLNNYGYSLLLARRYDEAAAILAQAYERGQSSPFAATIRANLRLLQGRTGPRPTVVAGEDIVMTVTDNLERTHALRQTAADRHALRIGYLLPAPVRPVTAQPIAPPPPAVEQDEPLIHTVPPSRVPNEVVAAAPRQSPARKAARPVPEAAEDEDRTVAFRRYEAIGDTQGERPLSLPGRPARSPQLAGRREGQAWRRAGKTTKEAT